MSVQVMEKAMAFGEVQKALESSRAVLLCSADSLSAWRCREQLFDYVELEAELRLSALLLRTNHKSGESWAQRRRILGKALEKKERQRLLSEARSWLHLASSV